MPKPKIRACINPYKPDLVWVTTLVPDVANTDEPYISVFLGVEEARRLAAELLEVVELGSDSVIESGQDAKRRIKIQSAAH